MTQLIHIACRVVNVDTRDGQGTNLSVRLDPNGMRGSVIRLYGAASLLSMSVVPDKLRVTYHKVLEYPRSFNSAIV